MNDYNYRVQGIMSRKTYQCQAKRFDNVWVQVGPSRETPREAKRDCEESAMTEQEYLDLQPIIEFED